jgi:NADPH:quinone reductase-like Zn-dependent oxidoreductase
MKAVVYSEYGGPEVLQLKEIPTPIPKDDEILIKVHAVSLNDWDLGNMEGKPYFMRMQNGFKHPKQSIPGSDIAGIVVSTGKLVTQFKAGDEVYGDLSGTWGGLAEYVCAKEKTVTFKPKNMSFVDAASIPQAAMLAVQGLIDKGNIQQGQKILINGAGGGVGIFGVQIAKLYGSEVTGVDHTSKLNTMRSIGFDHVIDYTNQDFTKIGETYDLILDAKTNKSITAYLRALNPGGKYVTVGGKMSSLLSTLLFSPIAFLFTKKKFHIVMLKLNKDLPLMNELFESGKIKTVIDGPYRFEEYNKAFEVFSKGIHKGKVVINIYSG